MIANAWAQVLVVRATTLFDGDSANLQSYQAQLSRAGLDLQAAEQTLAESQSENPVPLLTAQLNSQQARLTDYLNQQHQANLLLQDVIDLRDRMQQTSADTPVSAAADVAILMLVARVYGGGTVGSSGDVLPFQIQLGLDQTASTRTVQDQLDLLEDLRITLESRRERIGAEIVALNPQLFELQGALAEAQAQEVGLTRARDLAELQYLSLTSQVEQAQLAAQEAVNSVRIASSALVPTNHISPRRTLNVLVGTALGGLVGILVALTFDWWAAPMKQPARLAPTPDQVA
jgi:hypothetical protein